MVKLTEIICQQQCVWPFCEVGLKGLTKIKQQGNFKTCNAQCEWGFYNIKETPFTAAGFAIKIHKGTKN